jgi:hypothetical protein
MILVLGVWTFLRALIRDIAAADFFVVPTLTFRLLFGFLILRRNRRELVHVNVTDHPTAAWAAHQLVESFPKEEAPKYPSTCSAIGMLSMAARSYGG